LVVEDSFLLLMALEIMFDDLGWIIVGTAARKSEALALAASEEFDAALLDVNLDGEMSWDVAVLLRERGIPFVFSTGYDISNTLPPQLVGSPIIGKPFLTSEVELQLRKAIIDSRNGVPSFAVDVA